MIFFSSTSYLPAYMTSCHRLLLTILLAPRTQGETLRCGRFCVIPPHRFWSPIGGLCPCVIHKRAPNKLLLAPDRQNLREPGLLLGAAEHLPKFSVAITLPTLGNQHTRVNTLAPNNEPYKLSVQYKYINTRAGNHTSLGKAFPIAIETQSSESNPEAHPPREPE